MKRLIFTLAMMATLMLHGQNKPYITRVYDFMPAPGQFVNSSPQCEPGDSRATVMARVEKAICGLDSVRRMERLDGTIITDTITIVKPGLISLGSFGGYVVFGFDHPVVNVAGELDFQVFGNAFGSDSLKVSGGSCEPGIVMVSRDLNGNGLPDDPWYELAGSDYSNPRTQKHFTITYYKPDENKTPVPDPNSMFITDTEYIRWTSNSVDSLQEGHVARNSFHAQSYWPGWAEGETLTFTGTKLPGNAVNERETGEYWVQYFMGWGYVDNRPDYAYGYVSGSQQSNQNLGFNIEWAVDEAGTPVHLAQVDFIKVYSAMLQQCGWLGETSTEVCGGIDLHPDAVAEPEPAVTGDLNGDATVDVDDMNLIINIIVGKNQEASLKALADLNADGTVDVDDMNALINIILHKG